MCRWASQDVSRDDACVRGDAGVRTTHTVLPRATVLVVMLSSRPEGAGTCALRSEAVWAPLQVSGVQNRTATMAAVVNTLVHRVWYTLLRLA